MLPSAESDEKSDNSRLVLTEHLGSWWHGLTVTGLLEPASVSPPAPRTSSRDFFPPALKKKKCVKEDETQTLATASLNQTARFSFIDLSQFFPPPQSLSVFVLLARFQVDLSPSVFVRGKKKELKPSVPKMLTGSKTTFKVRQMLPDIKVSLPTRVLASGMLASQPCGAKVALGSSTPVIRDAFGQPLGRKMLIEPQS